jgi:putative oxidoreductase
VDGSQFVIAHEGSFSSGWIGARRAGMHVQNDRAEIRLLGCDQSGKEKAQKRLFSGILAVTIPPATISTISSGDTTMHRLFPRFQTGPQGVALLVLRLVTGFAFILHGWPKIQNPTAWMGPDAPVPGAVQLLPAMAEFGGGIVLMLGLLTPIAALGIAMTMLTAILMVHVAQGDPFVNPKGGPSWELAASYLVDSIVLLLLGPGRFSIDALLFDRPRSLPAERA